MIIKEHQSTKTSGQTVKIDCSKEFELTKANLQTRKFTVDNRDERYEKLVVVNIQHGRQRQRIQRISSYNNKENLKIDPFNILDNHLEIG